MTIRAYGHVTGMSGYGIWARQGAYGDLVDITTYAGTTITGATGGIYASNAGAGGEVFIVVNGDVTGTNGNGISAHATPSGNQISIDVNATGTVLGASSGITAINYGNFAINIMADGTVTGTAGDGIYASNSGSGTYLSITTGAGSTITGSTNGINAYNKGTGYTSITANGDVTGTSSDGIYAKNSHYGTHLTITTGAGSMVSGSTNGIDARNYGSGTLSITVNGAVMGTAGYGIRGLEETYAADGVEIITGVGSTITGDTGGIYASNATENGLSITVNGDVTGANGNGISAHTTSPAGGGIGINVHATGAVLGASSGIAAFNYSNYDGLAITMNGAVTGTAGDGIYVRNNGNTYLTITTGAGSTISGGTNGIDARNYGNGALTITNAGTITGATGIAVTDSSGGGTITNEATGTIDGTGGTAIALNNLAGATAIDINGGHIIGDVVDNNPNNGYSTVTVAQNFTTQGNFTVSAFDIAAAKTLKISSGDTITANNFTTNGGTLTFGVYSTSNHGEIVVNNGGVDLTGETITVAVDPGAQLAAGEKIEIIDGANALTGGPGATPMSVADNAAYFNFKIVDGTGAGLSGTNGDLYLEVFAAATACANAGGSSYTCAGTTTHSQGIYTNNASVSTSGPFHVNTTTGNAITITGDGALSFTDTHAGTLYTSDANGTGLYIHSTGDAGGTPGSVTVNTNSAVSGGTYGIKAFNQGTGTLTITADGDVTGGNRGIYAHNYGTALSVTTGAGTTVTGTSQEGILARNYGTGALMITADGDVTGGISGIYAGNHGTSLTVTTGSASNITGIEYGIEAFNYGAGALTITANGTVTATGNSTINSGIYAINSGASSLTITTGAGSQVSGRYGIFAQNRGSGALTITVDGAVTGTGVHGVDAGNSGTNLIISQGSASTITGARYGIIAGNFGTGYLSITADGHVTGTSYDGIYATNFGSGATLSITTGAGSVITGGNDGIYAKNQGSGALTIANSGDVSGATGILVEGDSAAGGTITNASTGTIDGTGGTAISLYNLAGPISLVINGGHIIGDVVDNNPSAGHSSIEIAQNFTTQGNFTVSNFAIDSGATLTPGANKNINSQTAVADSGTINVTNTGAGITGGLHVESGGALSLQQNFGVSGALTNEGTTSIATGAVLTAATMSAAGSAGTLSFGVASGSSLGQLVISGGALNLTDQTVTVNVAGNPTLTDGEALEIASGTGAVINGPGGTPVSVTDNLAAWDFALVDGTGSGVGGATADMLYLLVEHNANQTIVINSATATPQTLESGDNLTVTNAGSITSAAAAVKLGSGVTAGTIDNSGTIDSTGNSGILLAAGQTLSGGIINESGGTIEGTTGITVAGTAITAGITTDGAINGTGGTAIAFNSLTGATPLTIQGGQIIGNVTDSAPQNGDSPTTIAGNFTTGGNFTVSGLTVDSGKTLTLANGNTLSSHSAIQDAGTIVSAADGSSVLNGGLSIAAGGALNVRSNTALNGALTNAGSASIAAGAVLTAATMNAAGSAGTITFGVASATSHGELVVSGGAANLTNETIAVDVANGASLTKGDTILIVDGAGALIGGPGATPLNLTDNSALYNFQLVDGTNAAVTGGDNSQAYLLVGLASAATVANTPNNASAATALAGATNPQLMQIQTNLNNAATPAAVNQILSSITPTVDGSGPIAAQNVSGNTFDLEAVRLADLNEGDTTGDGDGTGMAAGDALDGVGMWGQVFGQHSSQDERDNIAGYGANTFGAAAGIDTRNLSDKATIGLGISYGNTHAKSRNINSSRTDTDSYQVSLYGDYDFSKDTYLDGLIGYSFNDIDTIRHDVGGISNLTAHGSTNASQFSGQAELGRHYAVQTGNVDTILTPNAILSAINYEPNSYTETGAGGADFTSRAKT